MVTKKLLVFLGVVLLLGMVSAAGWDVEITKLNGAAIQDNYSVNVTSLHYQLNGINCSQVSDILFSKDEGATNISKGGCSETGGEILLPNLMSVQDDNDWMIIVQNTDNTTETDSVDFWVDSIKPVITILSPSNEDFFIKNSIYFTIIALLDETNPLEYFSGRKMNFTVWDTNGVPDKTYPPTNSSGISYDDYDSEAYEEDGNYTYNITATDILGNIGYNDGIIMIDTHAPECSSDNSFDIYEEGKTYSFNVTCTDATSWVNESSVLFTFDGVSQLASKSNDVYSSNVSDLAVGNYTYSWNASDMAGNEVKTEDYHFTLIKATPNLTLEINTTWDEIYGMTTNVTGNAPAQIISNCSLYKNSVPVSNPEVQTLGAGIYNYTFMCNETQNYTSALITQNLTVNPASPSLTLSANKTIIYGEIANVSADETNNNDDGCNYTLYANGVNVSNPDNNIYENGTIDYIYNTSGCENYTSASVSGWLQINKALQDAELEINDTDVDYGEAILVTCNGTLYRDGEDVSSENDTAVVLGAGTYNYTCTLDETANFSADSESALVTVNKIPSSVQLYLNSVADNLTVEYMEFFLIEGNVSIGEGNAQLFAEGFLITPVNSSGKDVSTNTFMLSGTYKITAVYEETQNYTASSETYFVTVNPRVDTSSSSGSSCKTVYSCVEWSEWSACENGLQTRTCLDTERVSCGTGNTSRELDDGETQSCEILPAVVGGREIQEGEPIVVPEENETSGSGITGAVIGFAKSGTGIITIITLLVLSGAYGFVHYKRKHS